MSALLAAALFFGCSQPSSSSSNSEPETTGGTPSSNTPAETPKGNTPSSTTPGDTPAATTIVPPSEFTPPSLPRSQGIDIFKGKTLYIHDDSSWTFNNDGTYTETHSQGTTSNRYSYDAGNNWLYTCPITLEGPAGALNYEQAYNLFSNMTTEDLLQMIPDSKASTIDGKILFLLSQMTIEEIESLNLSQNASNTQILGALLNFQKISYLSQFSNITKYIVSTPSTDEYKLTYYYAEDYREGKYRGSCETNSITYNLSYRERTATGQDGKPYNLSYYWYENGENQQVYYKLDSLPTEASGNVNARNINDNTEEKTITYTRSWSNGITTFNFTFDNKNFTLTNDYETLREQSGNQSGTSGGESNPTPTPTPGSGSEGN